MDWYVIVPPIVCGVGMFVLGFVAGHRNGFNSGVTDTERRWSEISTKAEDRRKNV